MSAGPSVHKKGRRTRPALFPFRLKPEPTIGTGTNQLRVTVKSPFCVPSVQVPWKTL
jgi:hypothetical protein